MSLKLGAFNSRAEHETVWQKLRVLCIALPSGEILHSFYQNLKGVPDPKEAKSPSWTVELHQPPALHANIQVSLPPAQAYTPGTNTSYQVFESRTAQSLGP